MLQHRAAQGGDSLGDKAMAYRQPYEIGGGRGLKLEAARRKVGPGVRIEGPGAAFPDDSDWACVAACGTSPLVARPASTFAISISVTPTSSATEPVGVASIVP